MTDVRMFGYSDPFSARAGKEINFMISAEGTRKVNSKIVRLIHGDENPDGPGFLEEDIQTEVPETLEVKRQYVQLGSFAEVKDHEDNFSKLKSFSMCAFIWPSLPGKQRQTILGSWSVSEGIGYALGINPEGKLEFWIGDGKVVDHVTAEIKLVPKVWVLAAVSFDSTKRKAIIYQINAQNSWNSLIGPVAPFNHNSIVEEKTRIIPSMGNKSFLISGSHEHNKERGDFVSLIFNGKIDRPAIFNRVISHKEFKTLSTGGKIADPLAFWDTSAGYDKDGIKDEILDVAGKELHAQGINKPVRGMTGWNWRGKDDSFRLAPEEYGGIAFHDDALIDCKWDVTVSWTPPDDIRSGVYALKIWEKNKEDYIPVIVRPSKPRAKIAVQMSTFTYLAYANERLAFDAPTAQAIVGHTPVVSEEDIEAYKLLEFGLSTYDHHNDGAGVCYSSWKRPILNLRPKFRLSGMTIPWGLPADLSLLWWLENENYDFDLITDHDLDREGVEALNPYKVVINVTHPEYYSEKMLDGTEEYLMHGGRLLYIGGNGYYWVTAACKDDPSCIEVRKLDTGSRAWQAEPGEGYLVSTGERSGLWRSRGRAPQKLVGLGFTTEGFDQSQPFERMPDSFHRHVAWIFDGIGESEVIGDFGLGFGGAAGIELDRYDLLLGTPPHTMLIASSYGHSDNYPLVSEEITYAFPGRGGSQDPQVRGDMIFFTTPSNGAVFAAGSIAWSQSLPCFGGKNNVGKVMHNVLQAFLKSGPLPGSSFVGAEKHWR